MIIIARRRLKGIMKWISLNLSFGCAGDSINIGIVVILFCGVEVDIWEGGMLTVKPPIYYFVIHVKIILFVDIINIFNVVKNVSKCF